MAWKYQIISIILIDKILSESFFSFDIKLVKDIKEEKEIFWDKKGEYKRYQYTENGVSPLTYYGEKNAVVKINSYEHCEFGLAAEDSEESKKMQEKRYKKLKSLEKDLEKYELVKVYGNSESKNAIICFGSTKGVCIEAAIDLGYKVIQPLILNPFPKKEMEKAFKNVSKAVCVEYNITGQLSNMLKSNGFKIDFNILRYDGRTYSVEELKKEISKVIK